MSDTLPNFDLASLEKGDAASFANVAVKGLALIASFTGGATAATAVDAIQAVRLVVEQLVEAYHGHKVTHDEILAGFAKLAADQDKDNADAEDALRKKFGINTTAPMVPSKKED
jgi:hypothetical protein